MFLRDDSDKLGLSIDQEFEFSKPILKSGLNFVYNWVSMRDYPRAILAYLSSFHNYQVSLD